MKLLGFMIPLTLMAALVGGGFYVLSSGESFTPVEGKSIAETTSEKLGNMMVEDPTTGHTSLLQLRYTEDELTSAVYDAFNEADESEYLLDSKEHNVQLLGLRMRMGDNGLKAVAEAQWNGFRTNAHFDVEISGDGRKNVYFTLGSKVGIGRFGWPVINVDGLPTLESVNLAGYLSSALNDYDDGKGLDYRIDRLDTGHVLTLERSLESLFDNSTIPDYSSRQVDVSTVALERRISVADFNTIVNQQTLPEFSLSLVQSQRQNATVRGITFNENGSSHLHVDVSGMQMELEYSYAMTAGLYGIHLSIDRDKGDGKVRILSNVEDNDGISSANLGTQIPTVDIPYSALGIPDGTVGNLIMENGYLLFR